MKLFTLNAHSLSPATDTDAAREALCELLCKERPDIMAFQEVCQSRTAEVAGAPRRMEVLGDFELKRDNYLVALQEMLDVHGFVTWGAWSGFKYAYETLEEGVGVLSASPILAHDLHLLSAANDPNKWKTRKAVGVSVEGYPSDLFYSVQFGWADDAEDPFAEQLKRAQSLQDQGEDVWLLGDFNVDAASPHLGYGDILGAGWKDTYTQALHKRGAATAPAGIDGWEGDGESAPARRIDYIVTTSPMRIKSARVVLDGNEGPLVSDHFGLLVESE